jgi:hypothetical protein
MPRGQLMFKRCANIKFLFVDPDANNAQVVAMLAQIICERISKGAPKRR